MCSTEEIENAINDLVSGKYDSKAEEISQKIMQENGIAAAAEVIEKYVSEGWE
jgi:UDP:flavonoid glycosyltransferase YjiC (YdhE family)